MVLCRFGRMWIVAVMMGYGGSRCATDSSGTGTPGQVGERVAEQADSLDEFGISRGAVDVKNRYSSVVSIRNGKASCSGVLVAPLLALSAAHCFCQPRSKNDMTIDASSCAQEVAVLSYYYERAGRGWSPRKDVAMGRVVVNSAFRSELEMRDGMTIIKSKTADLAVVHLERVLENTVAEIELGGEEVSFHEELIMVGFGATTVDGDDGGMRRFGGNIVSDLRLSDDRHGVEIRFRFPGAHTHAGDSGGPCFREKGDKRWLVGINGGYVSQGTAESWFTSTFSYRRWVDDQIEEAKKMKAH